MKAVRRWAAEQRLQPRLEVAHNLDDAIKYHADLDRRLDRTITTVPIPGSSPGTEPDAKQRKRIAANRAARLFVFVTNRDVPYTNNVSERNRRPSVIVRKVTNGFRCDWGPRPTPPSAPSSAPQRRAAHPTAIHTGVSKYPRVEQIRALRV